MIDNLYIMDIIVTSYVGTCVYVYHTFFLIFRFIGKYRLVLKRGVQNRNGKRYGISIKLHKCEFSMDIIDRYKNYIFKTFLLYIVYMNYIILLFKKKYFRIFLLTIYIIIENIFIYLQKTNFML